MGTNDCSTSFATSRRRARSNRRRSPRPPRASSPRREVGRPPSEGFAAACREATAGNPFLLVELLRALGPEQAGPEDGSAARLAEVAAAGASRSILTRLARLGEHSTAVARAVAVLEPNAEARLVAGLSGLPAATVADATEQLVRAHLLSNTRPPAFVHPLVREAVLSEVPASRRAEGHARAAGLLDRDGAAVDTVGAHLLLAGPAGDAWAVTALREAGAKALARGAPVAAVRYLRRALQEPPTKGDRQAVSRELGLALLRANDPEGIEVLRTVRAATEDPIARAELAAELTSSLGLRGGGEEATALLEESLAELPDRDCELAIRLRGWLLLQTLWGLERLSEGTMPAPGEEPSAETLAGRMVLAQGGYLNAVGLGTVARGLELAEAAMPDLETVIADTANGLPPQGAQAAVILADRGDRVAHHFQPIIEAATRRGAPPSIAGGYGLRAFLNLLEGNLRDGQGDAEVAVDIVRDTGLTGSLAIWSSVALRIAAARGDIAGGEELLRELWSEHQQISGLAAAALIGARGELRRAAGRHAEARHDFLATAERVSFVPLPNQEMMPWRVGLALCEAALGNDSEAIGLATETSEQARRAGGVRGIGIALRVQGSVTGGASGIELLRESVTTLAGTRACREHAVALVELGAALRRANKRKEARQPLREGLDLAHRCGATPLEEEARTELEATGARPRKAVYSGVESLTPSELRVARMAAEGLTNREIAQALTVTEKTIETHMRHIFQKLDLSSRTELAGVLAAD